MTIKRQWMIVLIFSAILSVSINSFVLSSLINRYFVDYTKSNYENHYAQIAELSREALHDKNYTRIELASQLETHLSDPIIRIKLFDSTGQLLADVSNGYNRMGMMSGMMNNNWMDRRLKSTAQEIDSFELSFDGVFLGRLDIVRYSSFGNSLETMMFKVALIGNSILSFGFVLLIMLIVGAVVSKRMSQDLTDTADHAINMDLGNEINFNTMSKVKEIRIIQQSLTALQSNLRLKQRSRKKLVDELIHQSRTPLTILKTHLEGFEDGLIRMSPEEIKTCQEQINNIESIIVNMTGMIDAEKDIDDVNLEEFEINQLLRQIVGGLKVQFDKKQVDLLIVSHQRITMKSDRYKLSQSIYNILTNAYKYTMPKGKVSITYALDDENITIAIEDTGAGIGFEDKQHLFDAYFRGSNSNNISGEGIGLYVVKENIKKLGGQIDVESEPGKGSRFIIKIPKNMEKN